MFAKKQRSRGWSFETRKPLLLLNYRQLALDPSQFTMTAPVDVRTMRAHVKI